MITDILAHKPRDFMEKPAAEAPVVPVDFRTQNLELINTHCRDLIYSKYPAHRQSNLQNAVLISAENSPEREAALEKVQELNACILEHKAARAQKIAELEALSDAEIANGEFNIYEGWPT